MQSPPDPILPSQHLVRTIATPEKRLLAAVLEEAVGTFQRYLLTRDHQHDVVLLEVEEWFASDDAKWLYSFVGICDSLGIEAAYVRAGLLRWRRRYGTPTLESTDPASRPLIRGMNGARTRVTANPLGMPRRA